MNEDVNTMPMAERIESEAAASVATISQVFDRYESELLAYALKLVKNRPVAEDLVQDAFLRLHPLFDSVKNPRAWLYRTTHNLAVNFHRANRRTVSMEEREETGGDAESPVSMHGDVDVRARSAFRTGSVEMLPMPGTGTPMLE